ncbi:MAG: nuclear transport factor 2 family protein [Pseudomonadota bacterium]
MGQPADTQPVEALCRLYLAAMESGDLDGLLALFTEDATATSPIFGAQPVRDFYTYVMRATSGRTMALKTVFLGAGQPRRAAVHVAYTRTVGDGTPATVEAVDVFELNEDLSRFVAVTIIYDTAPVRKDFE